MPPSMLSDAVDAARSLADYAIHLGRPTLRLGVTGLSHAGKTVFLTALVHHLVEGGRLPVFRALSDGRIMRVTLAPQPDDAVPRFAYEDHLAALTGPDRRWPESTRRISELRLLIEYRSRRSWLPSASTLTLDIVDYPGEWLLDLGLLEKSYRQWSDETLALSRQPPRAALSGAFLAVAEATDGAARLNEGTAGALARAFTEYLRACRDERVALSALPPGRFLMPGDLEGSPALTFAPLPPGPGAPPSGSLLLAMEHRFEAYKRELVRPFFRDHFARLDRQIVLVDALTALNAGPGALADLETALGEALAAFHTGRNTLLSTLFSPRVERVLFAATKADHLHHTSHDRLEAILRMVVGRAMTRARAAGATIDVVAMAAVRATREAELRQGGAQGGGTRGGGPVPAIVGVPVAGERLGADVFDGVGEVAAFPGDLPADPADALAGPAASESALAFRALRFRPPKPEREGDGRLKPLPHIRLDRALEFLLGDWLR